MSDCRVKVPTVLWPNERETLPQPVVHVSFGDDTFAASPAQARAAAEWLDAAHRAFGDERAQALAQALRGALVALADKPPRLVPERYLGVVHATDSDGAPAFLEFSVETAVVERSNPRIVLRCGESLESLGDTWWLLDAEAQRLAELVRARAAGVLTEAGPNQRPFLHVQPSDGGVELRFDDDLLTERGDDGVYRLAAPAAARLADLLAQAVAITAEQPPYVFVPPEPRDVLIADLDW